MMARKRMQRQSLTFVVVFLIAFISDIVVSGPSTPLRRRVRQHHNIKVRINATGDTIVLKFLLPNAHTKLEGYILGYGSRPFSKQFIQLPENGLSFVKEFDAEPKYLIAVKPIQINEVKKYCTGKVELEKPLHLVVGPVTPSSVLLSWGDELKSSYEGNILKECLEQGHYTVRYREKSKRWNYQTCPTSDTVIDNLKPNAVYEFGVKPISKEGTGEWSKPVVHNTSNVGLTEKPIKTISTRPINPAKPLIPGPQSSTFVTRQVHRNKTQDRLPPSKNFNSKTTVAPTKTTRQDSLSSGSTLPVLSKQPNGGEDLSRTVLPLPLDITPTKASLPVSKTNLEKCEEHHHNQPQETPQSIPDSQHPQHTNEDKRKQGHKTTIPMETKPPKRPPPIIHHQPEGHQESKPILTFHTKPQTQPVHIPHTEPLATFPFQKQLPFTPQTHNRNKHLPKIDPHPKLEPTYQTIHQTKPQVKPQPTLQHQSEMPLQPTNQLPADPVRTIDPRLKFQPTIKTLQSHNAIPEQPQQQPTANLLHHTSQQTQTSHPKYPIDSQAKLISQTTPSDNIQQPIHPKFQAQPRMPKPRQPLSTSKPIRQTQSGDQQRFQRENQNDWIQNQFQEFTSEAQPQPATESLYQTKKQTHLSPTTEAQQQWSRSQTKPQKESQTHPNPILIPHTENKKHQKTNRSTVQTELSPPLTLPTIAPDEHQEHWKPTTKPFVHTQQQIKPVTPPMTIAPLPLKPTSQTELQNREEPRNEPSIKFQSTSELIAQTEPQLQATLQPKPQIQQQSTLKPPLKLKPPKNPYATAQPTSSSIPQPLQPQQQPTLKPIFYVQPPPQPTSFSNLQNKPYPESQTIYLAKPHPQQYPHSQPTSKSMHQTQPHLHSTSKVNLQNELNPQSQPESQYNYQPQQPQTTINSILQTQKLSQPPSPPILQNEAYQQTQQSLQVHPPSQPTDKVIPHPQQQAEPTLQQNIQTQSYQSSQPSQQYNIHSTHPPFLTITNRPQHVQPNSQSVPHTKPQNERKATEMFPIQSQSTSQLQSHTETYTESQPKYHAKHHPEQYPKSQPMSQPIHQTQPKPTSNINLQNELDPESLTQSQFHHQPQQTQATETQKESQSISPYPHQNEPYPQSQQTFEAQSRIYQSQPQPSLITDQPYKSAQPSPQAETQKTFQHFWNEPHPPPQPTEQVTPLGHYQQFQPTSQHIIRNQPDKQSEPSPQQPQMHSTSISPESSSPFKPKHEPYPKSQPPFHIKPPTPQTKPQHEPQTKLHSHESKATAFPTFQIHSESTLHIQSHTKPYPESQPLVYTTPNSRQPQPELTLKPIFQTDSEPQSTSELKFPSKFQSQSQPVSPSISQTQQSVSTSRPLHQMKMPTQSTSQHMPKNEPPLQFKETFQEKHESTYQQYYPTFKPQQSQQPTYQTQTSLQPHSQTQYSDYQSTSQPILQTKHSSVFMPTFQIQTQSTPHTILQMQPQTQPGNKPLLPTRLKDSTTQPTKHPQPETKQQPPSHPTIQTMHQDKPQQTIQPTYQIPNQPAFQPTHMNIETQPISEFKLQKEPEPQQQTPKPMLPPKTTPKSQTQTEKQQPQPTPIFQKKHQPQSQPTSQHHTWTQQQPKLQSTSKPSLQTQQQNQNQPYTTLKPKVRIAPAIKHIPQTKPQPASKQEAESKPKPQPDFKTLENQREPNSSPIPQKPTFQPIDKTQSPSKKWSRYGPHRKFKSTTPQPVSQTQTHSRTKMTTEPKAENRVQMTIQPNVYSHKTVESQPILQMQPQGQPRTQPVPESQSYSQPQPRSTPTIKMQTTSQPILQTHQSQYKPTPHPKLDIQVTTKVSIQPQKHASTEIHRIPERDSQSIPIPHLSSKTQSQTVLKHHYTPWPQLQPQPGLQTESQTRTYTDPTKVTPGQAVFMAPSPPEGGKPLPRPELATENADTGVQTTLKAEVPRSPVSSSAPPSQRNITLSQRVPQRPSRPFSTSKTSTTSHIPSTTKANGLLDSGHDLSSPARSEERPSKDNQVQLSASPEENRPKQMDKLPGQDKLGPPKLRDEEFPAGTARPRQERRQETTTAAPAVNLTNYDSENSTGFSPSPASKVDSAGNKRFIAPHVIYKTNKKPEEPCSITSSLTHFPDEEANDLNVTSPPRIPPSNLTVVTVEGCPSFVILDWQKSDNETTEYQVYSTTEGPSGNVTSIVTTNQTHTAVENLKPETNYTFTVTPKNELGTGPATDPVAFSTEAADPRVSEYVSGKNSIWTDFPFQFTSDAYSECHGRMFVKRTWYRKFVGIQLCNSLRYQIYLSDSLNGKFYNIGDLTGSGEDHCQFVDSFLDGNTGAQIPLNELPKRPGFYRAMRHEPVSFGEVGGNSRATYVGWYECGTPIPGKW
ncbi:fibronectin type III domain-containing protein 1 isoform X2 [Takifugu flavidus]|uniref:fibronectin type III domain-containing protein 1 isoform X2 n=1 Tax=Takifugu flavidus TaxID=433684 RepID=UPI002544673C|nr:fibronectin type III domain-containing protein 1 isoform X2 [Takifugu flavidus]